ncbi:hypothetical protein E4U54_001275 [Claviceps lovelessii]|nr:hypothetical protein E4U54_001275 [Claviceps lovelessii]
MTQFHAMWSNVVQYFNALGPWHAQAGHAYLPNTRAHKIPARMFATTCAVRLRPWRLRAVDKSTKVHKYRRKKPLRNDRTGHHGAFQIRAKRVIPDSQDSQARVRRAIRAYM